MKRAITACLALAAAGCSSVHSNAPMAENNKALVMKFVDRINKHDLTVIDEVFDAAYVERSAMPGLPPNREGIKEMFGMFLKAFPDMTLKTEHLIAEGDLAKLVAMSTVEPSGPQKALTQRIAAITV